MTTSTYSAIPATSITIQPSICSGSIKRHIGSRNKEKANCWKEQDATLQARNGKLNNEVLPKQNFETRLRCKIR